MPILTDNPTDQQRDQAIEAVLKRIGGNDAAAAAITVALPDALKNQMYDYARRKSVDDTLEAANAVGKRLTITQLTFHRHKPTECIGSVDIDPNGAWKVHSVSNGKVRIVPQQGQVMFEIPYSQVSDLLTP